MASCSASSVSPCNRAKRGVASSWRPTGPRAARASPPIRSHNRQAFPGKVELAGANGEREPTLPTGSRAAGSSRSLAAANASAKSANSVVSVEGASKGRAAPAHDIDESGPITQATSDRFGLVGQGEAAFERAVEDELTAQRGEKTRPFRAVGIGKGVERRLDHIDLLGVELAQRTEPTSAVGQCRRHQAIGVAELLRPASRFQEGLAERGDARLALGGAETDQQVDATSVGRHVTCGRRARAPGRSNARRRREREPPGPPPRHAERRTWPCPRRWAWWRGEKWRASSPRRASLYVPIEALDGLTHRPVQSGAPRRTQVLVEGVLDEGVRRSCSARGSPVAFTTRRRAGPRSRRSMSSSSSELGHLSKEVEVEVASDHRRRRQDLGGVVPEA